MIRPCRRPSVPEKSLAMKNFAAICCLALTVALSSTTALAGVTVPTSTPFSHNAGFNYDPWFQPWTAYSQADYVSYVAKDFDVITQDMRMIHTYHGAGVGTPDLVIDPGQYAVMNYAKLHQSQDVELFVCTNQDAATAAKLGDATYAASWVQTILLDPLDNDVSTVKSVVKAIGIGNEVDAQTVFSASDMDTAIKNLTTALDQAGLGDIPITTSIANLANNPTAKGFVDVVQANWQSSWGSDFVFANNYPWMQGGDIGTLKAWYEGVQDEYSGLDIFIAETGYPSVSNPAGSFDKNFPAVYGGTGEYQYITGLFDWLGDQYTSTGGYTVPTFIFSGTDMPKKVAGDPNCSENNYGIYQGTGASLMPKTDANGNQISIPSWVANTH